MSETIEKWEKQVARAEEHAQKVFDDEVERLEKQIESTDKAEAREVKRVEREVAFDAWLGVHHVEHLGKVIEHEAKKVEHAYARLAEKAEKGASDNALTRAAEHAARVEDDADRHIAKVFDSTLAHLERDAKAAAHHVYVGLEKLGLDEDHLADDAVADADRVAKALENVGKKIENA